MATAEFRATDRNPRLVPKPVLPLLHPCPAAPGLWGICSNAGAVPHGTLLCRDYPDSGSRGGGPMSLPFLSQGRGWTVRRPMGAEW